MALIKCSGGGAGAWSGGQLDTISCALDIGSVTTSSHSDETHCGWIRLTRHNVNTGVEITGTGRYKEDCDIINNSYGTTISGSASMDNFIDYVCIGTPAASGGNIGSSHIEFNGANLYEFIIGHAGGHSDTSHRAWVKVPKEYIEQFTYLKPSNVSGSTTAFWYLADAVPTSNVSTVNALTVDTQVAIPNCTDYLTIGLNGSSYTGVGRFVFS